MSFGRPLHVGLLYVCMHIYIYIYIYIYTCIPRVHTYITYTYIPQKASFRPLAEGGHREGPGALPRPGNLDRGPDLHPDETGLLECEVSPYDESELQ